MLSTLPLTLESLAKRSMVSLTDKGHPTSEDASGRVRFQMSPTWETLKNTSGATLRLGGWWRFKVSSTRVSWLQIIRKNIQRKKLRKKIGRLDNTSPLIYIWFDVQLKCLWWIDESSAPEWPRSSNPQNLHRHQHPTIKWSQIAASSYDLDCVLISNWHRSWILWCNEL